LDWDCLDGASDDFVVAVRRKCGSYEDWGLHVWGNAEAPTQWQHPLPPAGSDEYGVYWEVNFLMHGELHFTVHKGDTKVFENSNLTLLM